MVDVANSGSESRTLKDLLALRAGLRRAIENACAAAGIPLHECEVQDTGDGFLILAPEGVDRGAFAGAFLTRLDEGLCQHNTTHSAGAQIRLRLALNTGEITRDETGTVSLGIIHTRRLLDSKPLRKALQDSTAVLAVIVSSSFYRDFVRQRDEYEPGAYDKVLVNSKDIRDYAWIRLLAQDPAGTSGLV